MLVEASDEQQGRPNCGWNQLQMLALVLTTSTFIDPLCDMFLLRQVWLKHMVTKKWQKKHTVDGQSPAPPHHFTLEGSHSNPRAPSVNVGVFYFSHCGGPNVTEGERGQQENCTQSGAGFCPS